MKLGMNRPNIAFLLYLGLILAIVASSVKPQHLAEAHFFGGVTRDLADGYQVLFVPFPGNPKAGDNSTSLNFSILKDGDNIYNVDVSFTIKNRDSGNVEEQLPYKFYEFSDITLPYNFQKIANYVITVETRVNGDPKYQANPLVTDFDISVKDPNDILSDNPLLIGGIGVGLAIVAIASVVYLKKKRSSKRRPEESSLQ